MTTLRVPTGLGARGRKMFREVIGLYDLDPQNLAVLHEAARCLDELDLLAAAVRRDGATTTGSTGQIVENPALAGLRQHRATFDRLLVRLGLPDADGDLPATPHQQRAQAANDARWRTRRQEKASDGRP